MLLTYACLCATIGAEYSEAGRHSVLQWEYRYAADVQRVALQRKRWQRYTDELFSRVHSLEEDLQKEQRHRRRDQNVAASHCTQVELDAEAKVSELHAIDHSKQYRINMAGLDWAAR